MGHTQTSALGKKSKKRTTGMRFDAPAQIPMTGERLKALETAYLTKLVPNKSTNRIAP